MLELYLTENSNKAIISAETKRGGGEGEGREGAVTLLHLLPEATFPPHPRCSKEEGDPEPYQQGLPDSPAG